ncbi:MAG TPA: MarR family transcriptional regulator [Rhizomicrobium sp.]|jgi:DNA-binding MarR family transcriptional regulator
METNSSLTGLEAHLGYWLRFVSNSVSAAFAQKLAAHDVSVAEWVAMRLIHGRPGVSATAIADEMGMTRGAISKIVARLEERGLIARAPLPEDARGQALRLNAKGARLLPQLAAAADRNDSEFFDDLPPEDRAAMLRILKGVVARRALKTIPVD